MSIITDILINDKNWCKENAKIEFFIKNLIKMVVPELKINNLLQNSVEIEISIVLTNDKEIQNLNKEYRQKDKPTNVLSFPATNPQDLGNDNLITHEFVALGDIILAFETIKSESKKQNKNFNDHLTHLVIHSILHLIGYDHMSQNEAEEMEKLEIDLLQKLAIDNPYAII